MRRRSPALELAALALGFGAVTLAAKAFGAGWGTASSFGQIGFVAVLALLLLTDSR